MYVFISVIVYSFIIKDEKITNYGYYNLNIIKGPARDACLCMGDLQASPALHFVFLITL